MSLSKLAVKRLNTLIDFMEGLSPKESKHFNMDYWVTHQGSSDVLAEAPHGIKSAKDLKQPKMVECGMAACAFGWACFIPQFRKAGLKLIEDRYCGERLEPSFNGEEGYEAAEDFFNLDYDQVDYLFGEKNEHLKTPKQWAKHARGFLKNDGEVILD